MTRIRILLSLVIHTLYTDMYSIQPKLTFAILLMLLLYAAPAPGQEFVTPSDYFDQVSGRFGAVTEIGRAHV